MSPKKAGQQAPGSLEGNKNDLFLLSFVSEYVRPSNRARGQTRQGWAMTTATAMNEAMNTRGQRILLWTVPPAAALFALAYLLFPVFSPPLSPTLTPEQVAAFFADNVT